MKNKNFSPYLRKQLPDYQVELNQITTIRLPLDYFVDDDRETLAFRASANGQMGLPDWITWDEETKNLVCSPRQSATVILDIEAMDPAGKIAVGKVCITTSDQATQLIKGLKFRFYDHKIESMAALEDLYPAFEGISECLRPYHQKTKQDFGIAYEGFISIQQEGKYTFHILLPETSDIQLSLNDQKVVWQ
ncbi:MAG: hypothetical protein AAGC64_09820 [Bacteroidota bacterium]